MVIGGFLIKPVTYLNLILVIIVIFLFIKMFLRKSHKKIYLKPWVLLFIGVLIFVLEEILTVLRHSGIIKFINESNYLIYNGFFEMAIITSFIYMLLLQKEHVKNEGY